MRSFARPLIVTALASAALFLACGDDKHLGGLVVAINSNVSVPKDIDGLGLAVGVNNVTKFSYVYGVDPNGKVTLPATLVLEEPSETGQAINIRIMAFSGGNIRIVRDAITTIPHGRVAVLRMQLSALSFDDGATGTVNEGNIDRFTDPSVQSTTAIHLTDTPTTGFDPFANIRSKCDLASGLGDIDGICQDATVDSSTLPDVADTQVAPTATELASCFDVGRCFAGATSVILGADCTFAFAGDPANLNVALVTDRAGFGTSAGFLAPLDLDPDHGFSVKNGIVSLPRGVCAKNPHLRGVITSSACPSKTLETPVISGGTRCSGSTFDAGTPDAGSTVEAGADGGDAGPPAPVLVARASDLGITSVAAVAPYPGTSFLYVADITGTLRVVDVSGLPAKIPNSKGAFMGDKGTAIATDGADVFLVTYPAAQSVQYVKVDVSKAVPTYAPAGAPIITSGAIYGAVYYQSNFYFASNTQFSLEYTPVPVSGTMTYLLSSAPNGSFDALATSASSLYGTLYDSTGMSTKPGFLGPSIMNTNVITNLTSMTAAAGHTGSLVYVANPAMPSQGSLVLTTALTGTVNVMDLVSGAIAPIAAKLDITQDTDQPYNLVTDGKGNVYYATSTNGIMKLPIYPKVAPPTRVAAAQGARTVAYLNGELYFTTDNGDPTSSGLMKVAVQ